MTTRRKFLGQIGSGVLAAGLGPALTFELGLAAHSWSGGGDDDGLPSMGEFESLAALIEETSLSDLLPRLIQKLRSGASLEDLVTASALANARRCGGTDYDGYHAFMAHLPALEMARSSTAEQAAIPVLKVIHRSATMMHGAPRSARMGAMPKAADGSLRDEVRTAQISSAEGAFAWSSGLGSEPRDRAIMGTVLDGVDVHRIVLAARSFDVTALAGEQHAAILLRQIVRHCADTERRQIARGQGYSELREQLPRLTEKHGFTTIRLGSTHPGTDWVSRFASALVDASRSVAAEDVAAAVATGISANAIGQAMSLAATRVLLRDPGRADEQPGKPVGSVHGASRGVHASDSMHAWRRVAKLGDGPHTAGSLTVAAHYVAARARSGSKVKYPPTSLSTDRGATLRGLRESIVAQDQARAISYAARVDELEAVEDALDLMREFAVRQDGALHAEKYFRTQETVILDDDTGFRGEHLQALARVVASQQCAIADSVEEIESLLAGD